MSFLSLPEPSQERVVCTFLTQAEIIDCGLMLRVRFVGKAPTGVKRDLRDIGFHTGPNETMQRKSNARAVMDTQAVLRSHYGSEKQ